jgi:hypothetical protein
MDKQLTLERHIIGIVHRESGGVKMTTLLTEVIAMYYEGKGKYDWFNNIDDTQVIDKLMNTIRSIEGLGILEYSWDMGGDIERIKYFVYRKPR